MLLSAVSVLVVAQSSSEMPEGLMNNPVYTHFLAALSGPVICVRDRFNSILDQSIRLQIELYVMVTHCSEWAVFKLAVLKG